MGQISYAYEGSMAMGQRAACASADHRLPSGAMIKEHDCVVLTKDLAAEGLKAGDVGTVVHIHILTEK
jgi:hypothetical protein